MDFTFDGLSSSGAVSSSLNTVVPVTDGAIQQASTSVLNQFVGATMDHLQGMRSGVSTGDSPKNIDIWAKAFGDYAHQGARGTSNGYTARSWGTAVGGDRPIYYEDIRLGLSGCYANSRIRSKDNSGRTDIDSYQGTLYAGYDNSQKPYYIDAAFTFAYNTYDSSRQVSIGALNRTAKSDYDGQQYSLLLKSGYTFDMGKVKATPLASMQYMHTGILSVKCRFNSDITNC